MVGIIYISLAFVTNFTQVYPEGSFNNSKKQTHHRNQEAVCLVAQQDLLQIGHS